MPSVNRSATPVACIGSPRAPGAFHNDPADCMIVATARRLGAPLVTRDERIRAYAHVKTLW
ncbi:twitching motility protein PilT [Burkholderia cepacia GG4]|uniref:Twitching motility protein PilT n=1 Tax=Burkholderia cepacia GG4 TaxID=1009846 RepID=A0A9W3K2W1_BURCE|nr:twitching motility protein PilT [Burkholderia cepacia GG4]